MVPTLCDFLQTIVTHSKNYICHIRDIFDITLSNLLWISHAGQIISNDSFILFWLILYTLKHIDKLFCDFCFILFSNYYWKWLLVKIQSQMSHRLQWPLVAFFIKICCIDTCAYKDHYDVGNTNFPKILKISPWLTQYK